MSAHIYEAYNAHNELVATGNTRQECLENAEYEGYEEMEIDILMVTP